MDRLPVLLWKHFEDICQIPRRSGNEAGMRSYIRAYAERQGFGFQEDAAGNCVVSVPGRGTGEHAPTVILQAHSDMVCKKDESDPTLQHDFDRDPIRTRAVAWTENGVTRDVIMATGTTLGADNGIGLVAALAVAVDPAVINCPPLELLVTVEEETGLVGARRLESALLQADLLINLDTEELGDICISCAGGRDLTAEWPVEREVPGAQETPLRLFIEGLPGGHSGITIHERRGNAIVMLVQELLRQSGLRDTLKLSAFSGGAARNVIPGDAEITVWLPEAQAENLLAAFQAPELRTRIQSELIESAAGKVACGAARVDPATTLPPISIAQTQRILETIAGIPNGVQAWSPMVPGLVETSNNVAVVSTRPEAIHLQCSTRSSREGAIEAFQEPVVQALKASGATVTVGDGYPGWPADENNVLLRQAEKTFTAVLGHAPKVVAVHAGLECGVFKGKRPTLQMISFGPDIAGAHTFEERVFVDSVPPFYACLTGLLQDLSQAKKG